jgi:hypothetical protein
MGLLLVAALAILSTAPPASSADGTAGPVQVSVNPTSGLTDGQVVAIHAQASPGSDLFEIRTHLCRGGAVFENTVDFAFDGPNCSPSPMSANADHETILAIRPGTGGTGNSTFRVGVGTGLPWTDVLGATHTLTCGPSDPCDLVVQLQVPETTVFYAVPLCFGACPTASGEPPAVSPPPVGGATSGETAGATRAAGAGSGPAAGPPGAVPGSVPVATTARVAAGASTSRDAAVADGPSTDDSSGGVIAAVAGSPTARRAARVFAGGVAGVVGGCLIAAIIARGRRQMTETRIAR